MEWRVERRSRAPSAGAEGTEARAAKTEIESRAAVGPSMETIVERANLKKALARVKSNKGASGIDGMTIDELVPYLKEHWPTIRAQLLDGSYKPQPVRRVEIPKASGGKRPLGIPTVLDRFIQQAVMQVLQADWDRTFSAHSFGFRPKRSAHQAVERAQKLIASGHGVVVDIDLEKFFDRVNHDILMGLVAKRVSDKRILKLIRGFLTAGVLTGGLVSPTEEGTPQGGPLSPLLSNLMLDVLDKELEARAALAAVVESDAGRAGQGIGGARSGLQLHVRETASAAHRAPGSGPVPGPNQGADAPYSRQKPRADRQAYLIGWRGYFGFCETPSVLRDLDQWTRRRLRAIAWKQWKRGPTRFAELRRRGVGRDLAAQSAGSPHGPWRLSNSPAPSARR